jgi:alpha-tubulin suppressor-like RCC1 family protein
LSGCGSSAPDAPPAPPAPPAPRVATSVAISPATDTLRAIGDTLRLVAAASDAQGVIPGKTVLWSSSDPAVASIASDGKLRAVTPGSATIRAVADGAESTMYVLVEPWARIATSSNGVCVTNAVGTTVCFTPGMPGRIRLPVTLRAISGGTGYWCGIATDSTAHCWGANQHGQLGDGSRLDRASPAPIASAHKFFHVAAMTPVGINGAHACALAADSTAHCWGAADQGQLGIGALSASTPGISACNVSTAAQWCATSPLPVTGGLKFRSLTTGSRYTCGVGTDHALYCWGMGSGSYTGNGSAVPMKPSLALPLAHVSSSLEHTCGVTVEAVAYCWGADVSGKLGGGPSPVTTGLAVKVAGSLSIASTMATVSHTCALTTDARAWCWGRNREGQLGSAGTDSNVPIAVMPSAAFVSLSASVLHTCGILSSGAAYCWGNSLGATPVRVADF